MTAQNAQTHTTMAGNDEDDEGDTYLEMVVKEEERIGDVGVEGA